LVVGVLALQGSVEPHAEHLRALGVTVRYIKNPQDLDGISGLILPGGESTTMIKLAKVFSLWEPLQKKAKEIPYWGVCAGSILMARTVENPAQESLDVMDVVVRRNAYGRQLESFVTEFSLKEYPSVKAEAVFIRAPKFMKWGSDVRVGAEMKGEAVFLDTGTHMVTAFHPELTKNHWAHEIFLKRCKK
jgi:5'-phosphate synthase pdxT subunit